jgi:thiol-disulfide isomerase/thioredoxin
MPFININDNLSSQFLNENFRNKDCIFFYYWNSCGHCHQFKPIFHDVIQDLRRNCQEFMRNALIFEIEFDNFNYLPDEFKDVQAFPSVITYSNGIKMDEFNDQRTKTNLNNFILSSLGEPSKTYKTSMSSSTKKKRVVKKYPKSV